jgi:hypothetical protein
MMVVSGFLKLTEHGVRMSYRECDFMYVKHLCDEWLAWNERRYQQNLKDYENLPAWKKWIEVPPVNHTLAYFKVLGLKRLIEMDGGLNRIVHLSSEDIFILYQAQMQNN